MAAQLDGLACKNRRRRAHPCCVPAAVGFLRQRHRAISPVSSPRLRAAVAASGARCSTASRTVRSAIIRPAAGWCCSPRAPFERDAQRDLSCNNDVADEGPLTELIRRGSPTRSPPCTGFSGTRCSPPSRCTLWRSRPTRRPRGTTCCAHDHRPQNLAGRRAAAAHGSAMRAGLLLGRSAARRRRARPAWYDRDQPFGGIT